MRGDFREARTGRRDGGAASAGLMRTACSQGRWMVLACLCSSACLSLTAALDANHGGASMRMCSHLRPPGALQGCCAPFAVAAGCVRLRLRGGDAGVVGDAMPGPARRAQPSRPASLDVHGGKTHAGMQWVRIDRGIDTGAHPPRTSSSRTGCITTLPQVARMHKESGEERVHGLRGGGVEAAKELGGPRAGDDQGDGEGERMADGEDGDTHHPLLARSKRLVVRFSLVAVCPPLELSTSLSPPPPSCPPARPTPRLSPPLASSFPSCPSRNCPSTHFCEFRGLSHIYLPSACLRTN